MQKMDLSGKQNHYLTRLGITEETQALFYGTYKVDTGSGGIYFEYGDAVVEQYNLGFHLIPSVPAFWKAGELETNIVSKIIIGSSALDIISYFSRKLNNYSDSTSLMFLSTGTRLYDAHLDLIRSFGKKEIILIFDNTFLGRISDIKVAAALMNLPIQFKVIAEEVIVKFKDKSISFDSLDFSLNAFRKEFNIRTPFLKTQKSKGLSFLQDQLNSLF
ncbi:MAG: hypothetical protein EOP45_03295 [Sphingobacteriaceae bacterium]|nr:MAG: hypothetical protein EOP45_03295 [Sphingobacteriaceae bacterium]